MKSWNDLIVDQEMHYTAKQIKSVISLHYLTKIITLSRKNI